MENNNIVRKARKDLNMVIISGKLTRPIQFTDANGNERDNVYVELYTYVAKTNNIKDPENYKHFTVYVGGKNVERLKKLNLVKGSALTVEGHINSYSVPKEDGSYVNRFNIVARDFYPSTFSGNTNAVILTARLASRKASSGEGKKESIMKMFRADGKPTQNIDEMASLYFNIAVDNLGKKGNDGQYMGNTQFIPCVAYAKDGSAKRIYNDIVTGYSILINGSISTTDFRDEKGKFIRRSTRVCIKGVRILEKSKDENIEYRKKNNLPIPQAKQATPPTPAPAPVEEPDYADACDF